MREHWPDGWFAARFLPRERRTAAACVFAVLHQLGEVASAGGHCDGGCSSGSGCTSGGGAGAGGEEQRRVAGAILDHLWRGEPTGRADLDAFAGVAAGCDLRRDAFEAWVDAVLAPVPPRVATWSRLRTQLEAVAGPLGRITAAVLGAQANTQWTAMHTAMAMTRLIEHAGASKGVIRLPLDDLTAAGLTDRDVLQWPAGDPRLRQVIDVQVTRARTLLHGGAKAVRGIADARTRRAVAVLIELEHRRLDRAAHVADAPGFTPRPATLAQRLAAIPRAMRRAAG